MTSEIRAISPVFNYAPDDDRFCVIKNGRAKLEEIGRRLSREGGLVAIYVPEDPERDYDDDPRMFGRVVALVRPLPMPLGHSVEDYESGCRRFDPRTNDLVDRWPVGWPSEVVFFSAHGGPVLRDVVLTATGNSDYHAFIHPMRHGPIDLTHERLPRVERHRAPGGSEPRIDGRAMIPAREMN